MTSVQHNNHIPVLYNEILDLLDLAPDEIVIDGTLGFGGHALGCVTAMSGKGTFIGIDQDKTAIDTAKTKLAGQHPRLYLAHADFSEIGTVLNQMEIPKAHKIYLDLGWNSGQIEDASRGLSFQKDGPLDMRLDQGMLTSTQTAAELLARIHVRDLQHILRTYADESHARAIAHMIVDRRKHKPFTSTKDLADAIEARIPRRPRQSIHPATKTFQALRIAVNKEYEKLETLLTHIPTWVHPGGRVLIISFHSGEDRIVKHAFRLYEETGIGTRITRKPITPSQEEVARNPRARSAKLRVLELL